MTKSEFSCLMAAIHTAYPNEKVTGDKNTVTLFWKMLSDMGYMTVAKNLENHIKTNKYPPTIAELRGPKIHGFNNFVGRNYNMDKLELALLGIQPVAGIEEIKEELL